MPLFLLSSLSDFGSIQLSQRRLNLTLREFVLHQVARQVGFVGRHIKVAVSAQVEQNRFAGSLFLGPFCLGDYRRDGVVRFGSRDNAFSLGKQNARLKAF